MKGCGQETKCKNVFKDLMSKNAPFSEEEKKKKKKEGKEVIAISKKSVS